MSGITGSDKNDKVKNGLKFIDGAILSMAACNFTKSFITSSALLLVIRPAISKLKEARTKPFFTTTIPPPNRLISLQARIISVSLVPHTIKLWESWATVVAMAPDFNFNPLTTPKPILAKLWCLSITAIFNKSSSIDGMKDLSKFNAEIFILRWLVSKLLGMISITFNCVLFSRDILKLSFVSFGILIVGSMLISVNSTELLVISLLSCTTS